jgi:hypothetical protein
LRLNGQRARALDGSAEAEAKVRATREARPVAAKLKRTRLW